MNNSAREINIPVTHIALNPNNSGYVETLYAVVPQSFGQLTDYVSLASAHKILIKRHGGMGDILMLTPTLRQLHRDYAHLDIHVAIDKQFIPLLNGLNYVTVHSIAGAIDDDVSSPKPIYDEIIDLNAFVERSPRRKTIDRASLFAEAFGMKLNDGRPEYRITQAEEEFATNWWSINIPPDKPVIALASLATDPRRCWPSQHARRFAELATSGGATVLWLHSNIEARPIVAGIEGVVYGDEFRIRQLPPVVERCDVLVSVDSGLSHIGGVVQQKKMPFMVLLFGQWPPELRLKWYKNYFVFYPEKQLSCVPCFASPKPHTCRGECMRIITPEQVWKVVEKFGLGWE